MKKLIFSIVFLLSGLVSAQDERLPLLSGGLSWSSDGQYIAVGTSAGVHIHDSDDLTKIRVLDESLHIHKVAWSNTDLRIAYDDYDYDHDTDGVVIWDFATDERSEIQTFTWIEDIAWSPTDTWIAATVGGGAILVWHSATGVETTDISLKHFRGSGTALLGWSPDEQYIAFAGIANGIAIFSAYRGDLVDFIWHQKATTPIRWSPDGNLLAAGVNIWKINRIRHHEVIDEFAGDIAQKIPGGTGLSWHPDSTKLAFIDTEWSQDPLDFTGSGVVIWDITSGTGVKLPGVFIWDLIRREGVVEWSPDGSRLASISSDGRIVIWDTNSNEVVAEYTDYQTILYFYKDNL